MEHIPPASGALKKLSGHGHPADDAAFVQLKQLALTVSASA
jgi:hypothetical protein